MKQGARAANGVETVHAAKMQRALIKQLAGFRRYYGGLPDELSEGVYEALLNDLQAWEEIAGFRFGDSPTQGV